ncbi:MAG: type III-B CRISPR module-associated protein Cmr3 [Methylohalobius crimeensis]
MKTYFIEPAAPLVFRSGRPFGHGGDAESLRFPLPTTLAGAWRTLGADQRKQSFSETLLEKPVWGPLAACRHEERIEPLFPKPADALYLKPEDTGKKQSYALKPGELPAGSHCDLPEGLQPVFLDEAAGKGKPVSGPEWWSESSVNNWLLGKTPGENLNNLGWTGPQPSKRMHVGPDTLASDPGLLFQTEGLEFTDRHKRYGLLLRADPLSTPATIRLGADGRLSSVWEASNWPTMPESLADQLDTANLIRLILVTPALFSAGWKPGWLDEALTGSPPGVEGIRLKLIAAVVPRWEPVSGWDLAKQKPRAVRRMVSAGAVYWFQVQDGREALSKLWMQPVSDELQDRRDGFGLVVPGIGKTWGKMP